MIKWKVIQNKRGNSYSIVNASDGKVVGKIFKEQDARLVAAAPELLYKFDRIRILTLASTICKGAIRKETERKCAKTLREAFELVESIMQRDEKAKK